LSRPLGREEILAKIHVQFRWRNKLTELWRANGQVRSFNHELEQLVAQRSDEILATRDVAVFALAKLTESRDPETGEHVERMREYCLILGERLSREGPYAGRIDRQFLDDLYRSAPLHDIGKVGIPDAILLKPGRLTGAEFEVMKTHATIGADALANAARQSHYGTFLRMAIEITRHHHERFDGSGYPEGLAGHEIPLAARIVTLADVFDALISRRVYKAAIAPEMARRMIEQESGCHFDPVIVAAFHACFDELLSSIRGRTSAVVGHGDFPGVTVAPAVQPAAMA
jgi:putative two-component system response regulator